MRNNVVFYDDKMNSEEYNDCAVIKHGSGFVSEKKIRMLDMMR